ncbi:MAG: acyl-CoA dehydratase activase [Coriobacteriia bacterium]|nr:acyl-CoA dehydratase activase [Coriobacteriia bacterium]
MTRVLGIDIGSRSIDAVWLDGDTVADTAVLDTGYDPRAVCETLLALGGHDVVVATGYGRHVAREAFAAEVITEIKAYALGAHALFPQASAVLDIGGQDTKVIALNASGGVADFEMNDKCAAGTGKFLEVMARALGYSIEELGAAALSAESGIRISSMCTVFAESEVTGLVHRGEDRARISLGLHESIATRTLGSLKRIGASGALVFAGGVAKNPAMVRLVTDGFAGAVLVPAEAQTVGAYGAALHGAALST